MKLLRSTTHPGISSLKDKKILKRIATRAIITKEESILLLFTKRYNDYSLPGGGVDEGEEILAGFIRELEEETGAQSIKNISPVGIYEEYRPWHKPEHDVLHMLSYCYTCSIDGELGETKYESYEINNGMKPVWINIHEAISHNKETLLKNDIKGLSIERELFLLELVADQILTK